MSDALAPTVEAGAGNETAASLPRVRSPSLSPGTQVGRYELGPQLGRGGMGIVYRARDPKLARDVAVKLVAVTGLADAQARLEREAQAMAKLSHPHVCTVHDIGTWNGQLFIAMELCTGGTLKAWVETRRSWRDIVRKLVDAGRGLAAAHALDIVHRDFKPDNVMLTGEGVAKVTDFGLARSAVERSAVEGTPAYMAPEQLAGGDVDARSDQFAFAVSAWQALCGGLPFQPDPTGSDVFERMLLAIRARRKMRAADADVPARVVKIIARGLEAEPGDRWPSLAAMLDALERVARPRTRLVVGAIAGVLVIAAAAIVGVAMRGDDGVALFPARDSGLRSKALGPVILAPLDHVRFADEKAQLWLRAYERTGDASYMLDGATELVMVTNPHFVGDGLDCSSLMLLASYKLLRPGAPIAAKLASQATQLDFACHNLPVWVTTADPDVLDGVAEAAERAGDLPTMTGTLRKLLRLQPDRIGLWNRLGDDYLGVSYCKSAKRAYDQYLRVAPDADVWRLKIADQIAHCEQDSGEDASPYRLPAR